MANEGDLEVARLANLNDLLQLQDMAGAELDYLGRLREVNDPDSDGVDCDTDERPGG